MPKGLKVGFTAAMLIVCVLVAWWAVAQYGLRAEIADLTLKLETSRQREVKQQTEYDEVTAALPLAQEKLRELQPESDAAVQQAQELRAQRASLRSETAERRERLAPLLGDGSPEEALLTLLAANQETLRSLTAETETLMQGVQETREAQETIDSLLQWRDRD